MDEANSQSVKSDGQRVLGWIMTIATMAFGYYIGTTGGLLLVVLFFGPIFLGMAFGGWYFKKSGAETGLAKTFAWSNLITWLLPPLGVFTGVTAIVIGFSRKPAKRGMVALGVLGVLLSVVNGFLGATGALSSIDAASSQALFGRFLGL